MKKKEMTFEELVEQASLSIHSALLAGGGEKMKATVWLYLNRAIIWSKEKKVK